MSTCAACGHQPVAGPFCTRCGSATAPTAPPPTAPGPSAPEPSNPPAPTPATPSPGSATPPPRFPLFADEAEPGDPPPARFPLYADEAAPPPTPTTAVEQPRRPPSAPPPTHHRERHATSWLPWLLGVLFVALIATVGVVLLAGGDDGPGSATDDPSRSGSADGDGESGGGSDLTGRADPTVPKPARASVDNQGNRTTYVAANLSDGEPTTCWRTAGDATGKVLVFRFDEPVTITEVGLINGYAKSDPPNDWYAANRRVLEAEWRFDSGDPVRQTLEESRDLQTVAVDAVETRKVRLRLVRVSPPNGRDFTAISEISLRGE